MNQKEYNKAYNQYVILVNQVELLQRIASPIFTNFPRNLPIELQNQHLEEVSKIHDSLGKILSGTGPKSFQIDNLSASTTNLMIIWASQMQIGEKPSLILDFNKLLIEQEIIMLFAGIDAFIADTIIAMCYAQPNILKSNRKIDTATIIDCANWENLVKRLSEEYAYEIGVNSVAKRIEKLNKDRGLDIDISNISDFLHVAEEIRNIIVHNGCRVSQRFLDNVSNCNLSIGDVLPIENSFVSELYTALASLANQLYIQICKKFYKLDSDTGLPTVSTNEANFLNINIDSCEEDINESDLT